MSFSPIRRASTALRRRSSMFAAAAVAATALIAGPGNANAFDPPGIPVFLSEIHYDNAGGDVGEAVEITGPAGTDLTGWEIVPYNGGDNLEDPGVTLAGTIPDEAGGFGAVSVALVLQNGAPDGVALVDDIGTLIQFLSYEGVFTGGDGPANGVASTDIGVAETATTPVGQSLQLVGGAWTGPVTATFGSLNDGPPPTRECDPAPAITPISQVQGATGTSPCLGEDQVLIEGVVVADFEGASPELQGFYVQEQDADADADPTTSEGVFVFNPGSGSVGLGDVVTVTGTVAENFDQTQLSFATITIVTPGDGTTTPGVTPTEVMMPFAAADSLEAVEGMLVTFPQALSATEYFQLGRFGQVVVSSGGRLDNPTAVAEPGAAAQAVQAANDLNRLIIDDRTNDQNPETIIYGGNGAPLSAVNPLRGGDTTTGATGVMTYTWAGNAASGNAYRLRPATMPIEFTTANPRPTAAPDVGGSLQVASFNVLNYFLTIDEPQGAANCGPVAARDDCRGADSDEEFGRQRTKLLAALVKLDADVIGLVELENTELAGGGVVEPLADIVAGLNDIDGADAWDFVDVGLLGSDVIKVGVIYRTAAVTPAGEPASIGSDVDPRFDDSRNRRALAASFTETATNAQFTVVVNHFKSKGCTDATGLNVDQGDGQGCWNPTRTAAAEAIVDWLDTSPTGVEDPDVLVIGDLNAYALEDPVTAFVDAGFVDLAPEFEDRPYGYVFDGQWGYLDYALASASMVSQVTGAGEYHINADEVPVLDYNTDFQSAQQIIDLYAPDEFRTSDHDPVRVGLDLVPVAGPAVVTVTRERYVDTRTAGVTFDGAEEGQGSLTAGSPNAFRIAGRGNVPADAAAVVMYVTAVRATDTGFVTVFPCGDDVPLVSSLNYTAGVNIGNEIVAPMSDDGIICVVSSTDIEFTVDVAGFVPSDSSTVALAPERFLDTRVAGSTIDGEFEGAGRDAGQQRTQIAGRGEVPSDAAAVIINVGAVNPGGNGFITVHPCVDDPGSSSLNFVVGVTRANELIAPLDADGGLCVFTSADTDVIADVVGFLPAGSELQTVAPQRLLDTRPEAPSSASTAEALTSVAGRLAPGADVAIVIGNRGDTPANADLAILNITAVNPGGTGFLSIHDCASEPTNTSVLNYVAGVNGANEMFVDLDTSGGFCVYSSEATDLVVDIVGYTTA